MRELITAFLLRHPRNLRARWDHVAPFYKHFLRIERYASPLHSINEKIYPPAWRGFPPLIPFRILGKRLGWSVNYGEHKFNFRVLAGEASPQFNARLLYEYSKASVTRSVPFSLIGEGNKIFGARPQGGLTTAGIGGPVRTTHNDLELTMTNVAEPGHLFSGGYLEFRFVEINGFVYTEIRGGGYNNFKWINQIVGTRLFPSMAKAAAAKFRELQNLSRIEHSVKKFSDYSERE